MEKTIYRVSINKNGKYQVKKDGATRANKVFDTLDEAKKYANQLADKEYEEVVIDVEDSKPTKEKKTNAKSSTRKKPNLAFICLALLLGIGVGVLSGCSFGSFFFTTEYEFYLLGDQTENIVINHEFEDEGFIATIEGVDFKEDVSIEYKTKDGLLVESIDTTVAGTFTVTYTLKNELVDATIIRIVNVIDSTFISSDLQIHFLELGNKYTGDSVYIKAGDTDVLIDAGSRQASATTIKNYVDQYCTDGTLEYVIATHAHQDHIAGFPGSESNPGIFDSYECETIIDFAMTDATSSIYKKYVAERDLEVEAGAKHYTAAECVKKENGATNIYELSDGITMTILDSYFYYNKSSDENNYSVCVLITQGEKNFLFTGDLEEEGEEKLVEMNTLPKVEVFKGGHHGSYTASNECLLSVIQPKIICVCCCCGSSEYTSNVNNMFPAQAFIDRVAKYTDLIYCTTLVTDYKAGLFESMNGNIVINSNGIEVTVACSNNNVILKNTEWFKNYRTWPEDGK